jgi:hypothetical protein
MHRLYRKVYNYQTTRRYIPEEQNLNHSAAEAWNYVQMQTIYIAIL